jgi:hypothetical protein
MKYGEEQKNGMIAFIKVEKKWNSKGTSLRK